MGNTRAVIPVFGPAVAATPVYAVAGHASVDDIISEPGAQNMDLPIFTGLRANHPRNASGRGA